MCCNTLTHTKICQPHFLGSQAKSENLLFFLSSRDFNFFGKRSLLSFSPLLLVNFRNDVCKVSKKRGKPKWELFYTRYWFIRNDVKFSSEPVCCKKQQKQISWPVTGLQTRGPEWFRTDCMCPSDSPDHLGSLLYHSELQRSPIPQTSNWAGTFFLLFLTVNRL